MSDYSEFAELFRGVKFTFSINCCSGIVSLLGPDARCECWRCRKERGQDATDETERNAAEISKSAQIAMREQVRNSIPKRRGQA